MIWICVDSATFQTISYLSNECYKKFTSKVLKWSATVDDYGVVCTDPLWIKWGRDEFHLINDRPSYKQYIVTQQLRFVLQ